MASQDHGIHSFEECVQEGSDYLQQTLGRVHTRRILTHNKRREDGRNWISSSHDSKKIPQAMRNMNDSILEEPLIHLSIWIRNDEVMNEEDDEAKYSRRSLPTKQIKISIQLSFHDIVWLCICLYSVDVLCMFEYLHLYYWIAHDGNEVNDVVLHSITTYLDWNLFAWILGVVHTLNNIGVECI